MSQDRVCRDTRWGSETAYTFEFQRCLCYGKRPSLADETNVHGTREPLTAGREQPRNHRILVAWLLYNNDEYEMERCLHDYTFLPMNWLTVTLTGRPYIHCQLVFWDETRKQYFTYSVDAKRPVHVFDKKEFARGWQFIELSVTELQEIQVLNFCVAQLGKPLNTNGLYWALSGWPVSGQGQSWFCSELATAALAHAGLIDFSVWNGVKCAEAAAPHHLFDYLHKQCVACETRLLPGNPVSMNVVLRQSRARGKIELRFDGGLPMSVVQHARGDQHAATSAYQPPYVPAAARGEDLTSQLAAMPLARPPVQQHATVPHYVPSYQDTLNPYTLRRP